jgi:hypothetical protein
LALLGGACSGKVGDPSGGSLPEEPSAADSGKRAPGVDGGVPYPAADGGGSAVESVVASSAYPRLSHRQWSLTAQDLLSLDAAPDVTGFTADAPSATGFDNSGGDLTVSQSLWSDYQSASEALADGVANDPAKLKKVLPASGDARAQVLVSEFGARAFRRPLTSDQVSSFVALWKQGPTLFPGADETTAGAQLVIQAMLQAPAFLYRVEGTGKPDAQGVVQLNDYEVASRLSYMLWDSMPDAPLFAAAKASQLHTSEQIAQQAERMLQAPRAGDKLDEFHRQLLELRRYDAMHPNGLPASIGPTLRQETERFIHDALIDHDGSLQDLFTADYSFVNKDLASLYGLTGSFGSDLVRTDLDPTQRAGLLTQPGFLIYRSGDTAPILRGVYINLKFLCANLPPPPAFAPPMLRGETRRERIDSVTGKGTCGEGCHATMINPAGFPLEYFDDAGRYRTLDNGQPIDGHASYTFSDGSSADYSTPIEWARALASSEQAHACYVRHWLEFGFGRAYAAGDEPLVERVAKASRDDHLPVKQVLLQLVQSPTFRTFKGAP